MKLLIFIQMWESFSFFGMRALLVLFLISEKGYSAKEAFILYTLYIAFVKLFGSIGGYVVDRFVGYKQGVLFGAILIMIGHIALSFASLFFLGLGSIICGSALFRVSTQSLLSFSSSDQDRNKWFTLFYTGMNLGGLLAATGCGFVANIYGWRAGFGVAAFGMALSLIFLLFHKKNLRSPIIKTKRWIVPIICIVPLALAFLLMHFEIISLYVLPIGIVVFVISMASLSLRPFVIGSLFLLIFYFTAEELWGSLLMVFSETQVDRNLFGVTIPSAVIAAMNPLTIILFGPLVAKKKMAPIKKYSVAFFLLSLAFFLLYLATSIGFLMMGLSLIALGELFLTPTVYANVSKFRAASQSGLMMGTTTLALSMGTLFSGEVAKLTISPTITFLSIGIVALFIAISLFAYYLQKRGGYPVKEADEELFDAH